MSNVPKKYDGMIIVDVDDAGRFGDYGYITDNYVAKTSTQIKSAIGNNGEFSPTNPDIRFSRAEENSNSIEQTQENDNKKLNSLLYGYQKGEDIFNAMSSSIKGFLSKMPSTFALVDNSPSAFKQMMREMIRDSKQAELTVSDILKNSTSLKAEERTLLSDYLEKELALGITPPEDVVKVGAAMRMALSYQTDELVRLGMLSTESASRWRDTYLPRMYKEKKKDPITQAIVKRFDIKGEHLKGRGQFKEVDSSEVANYLELGWEDRGVSSKGKTIVWKDYTKEEREKMGEIRDAMLRFATGFLSTQRDIAVAKLFEKIAANEELASSEPVAGWVQIPKAFIQQTGGLMRYGKLSGMWVHPDVWENTKHYIQDRGDIERIYRKTLSIWKEGKTALNVVAHTNNIVSNVVMVTAAGANINDIRKGFDSLSNKDKYYKEAVEMGMMATGHYTGDIRDYFGDDLLGATTPTNFVFKALKKAWENPVFNKMREFYDLEDQMFRLTLYRKAREYGATQQQAVDYAETFMFDYADLPVGVKKIRDFGLPFISYTYKAVPAMTRLAFTKPHRMLAITGAAYGVNALAYALLGLDGDDEDKERASMPDYMQGRSAWGIPKLVRLPFGDTENPVFLDVYRWLPLGDFFSMNDRTGGVPIPTSAVLSGPYWNAYNTLIANRNGLTGGDYFEDTDSDKQTFIKSMRFGLSEWIPMYYHLDKNLNAITREFSDTPMSNLLDAMGYSGTNARGEPAELTNSLLGATGIKVRKFDITAEQEKKIDMYDYKIKALRREMRSIARDMSNTHQENDIEDKLKEIERLLNERDEMVKSWE